MKKYIIAILIILLVIIGVNFVSKNSVPNDVNSANVQDSVINNNTASTTTSQLELKNPAIKITGYGPAGKFHDFSFDSVSYSKISLDQNGLPIDGQVVIELSSVNTGIDGLNNHLKSEDFFDIAKNPQAIFDLEKVEKISDNNYKVTGNFTLRGVTKAITFDVVKKENIFSGNYLISIAEFGINYVGVNDQAKVAFSFEI